MPMNASQCVFKREPLHLLTEADATILELFDRVAELERTLPSRNVVPLEQRKKHKE